MFTHESNKELIRLDSVVARYFVSPRERLDGLDLCENAHEKLFCPLIAAQKTTFIYICVKFHSSIFLSPSAA